ncbi:MAG TPA: choice-of-anchor R domain-containing protein [Terriglobales bacterium]|nr:choice-of-anchor R domain-containing protein [Terriglobales bacterium]
MKHITIFLSLVLLSTLAAAQSKDGVVPINGGRNFVYVKPVDRTHPAQKPTPGLVTIYSNLGTGSNVYNGGAGTGVLGHNVPNQPFPEWVANGFTPTANHTVTQIQVGVTWVEGPNSVILSLNADNNGQPGKVLFITQFTNLPTFGTCCTLQTANLTTGVPVTQGTLYWVVLRTLSTNQGTWNVWNNNFADLQGAFSNSTGHGWNKQSVQELGAFAVLGQ